MIEKLRSLPLEEVASDAKPAFDRVFQSADATGAPFTDEMRHRMIVTGTYYVLDDAMFGAIRAAAQSVGDSGFYLTTTELDAATAADLGVNTWYVPFDDLHGYSAMDGFESHFENAVYSPQGAWGMLLSQDSYGVVGTQAEAFLSELLTSLDVTVEGEAITFLEEWLAIYAAKGSEPDAWIGNLLEHVYGSETARRLLLDQSSS